MNPERPGLAPVVRWRAPGTIEQVADDVAIEEPLAVRVDGQTLQITMRTPGHDDELAAGWLFAEGIIAGAGDLAAIDTDEPNRADVQLSAGTRVDLSRFSRHVLTSSSCGLCGTTLVDRARLPRATLPSSETVSASVLQNLPERLRRAQAGFERTGGLHAAGAFDEHGELRISREDVGRHNAVDKILGRLLLNGQLPSPYPILFVSGRVSFEIAQKALSGGFRILAAVSAPSSLAVEMARRSRLTLVGFLREGRFNVYSEPARLRLDG